jgi:gamma-glutamylcyclotransferase (GGCT)/AIG2-like uncharacterized protein YtfP
MSSHSPHCRVFLYGSLRQGSGNPHSTLLHSRCRTTGQGHMPGRLFRVGMLYGAVYEPGSPSTVLGEIIEIPASAAADILDTLDRYEGTTPGTPGTGGPPFTREEVDITHADGTILRCWRWRSTGRDG